MRHDKDHVVVSGGDRGESRFECRHCQAKAEVRHPILLDDWLAFAEAFVDRHGTCPKKATP